MFEFIYEEAYWVQTIITALITALATIIAAVITSACIYNSKLKKGFDEISKILTLSDASVIKHNDLSNEHSNLSKEHSEIRIRIDETKVDVSSIANMIIEEKAKDEMRFNNLTDKQKAIVSSVDNLKRFADEMKSLQEEKMNLQEENSKLLHDNNSLKEKCNGLISQNNILKVMINEKFMEHGMDDPEPDL